MKTVILAGGFGSRLSEETLKIPKPMVQVGDIPILLHIMNRFIHYGFNDFIICCGYKSEIIKEFFNNFLIKNSDVTFDLNKNKVTFHDKHQMLFKVTCVDTGTKTMTGGRLKRIKEFLEPNDPFFMTYGDGVADIDIKNLLKFHKLHKKIATVTAVSPPGRFGVLDIDNSSTVKSFREKIVSDQYRINAGYFVLQNQIFEYIDNDLTIFEKDPLISLSNKNELMAYKHNGFWHPMDTLRDKIHLNELVDSGNAPWLSY